MDVGGYVSELSAEGHRLGDAASAAGLDAAVPGCPEWAVRDLLAHVGQVHRWATAIVGGPLTTPEVEPPALPGDSELVEWYRAGHAALVETLSAAPEGVECFTFLPARSPLAFWARRQALETAIHRSDAEAAAGSLTPIDEALALDGMDELLNGFGARKKVFEPATVRLAPSGCAGWTVSLGPDGLRAVAGGPDVAADVTVGGTASEVYRWMWNRPADVDVSGDPALAAEWHKIRIRWG